MAPSGSHRNTIPVESLIQLQHQMPQNRLLTPLKNRNASNKTAQKPYTILLASAQPWFLILRFDKTCLRRARQVPEIDVHVIDEVPDELLGCCGLGYTVLRVQGSGWFRLINLRGCVGFSSFAAQGTRLRTSLKVFFLRLGLILGLCFRDMIGWYRGMTGNNICVSARFLCCSLLLLHC